MSLKNKKFRLFWVVLLASFIAAAFINNCLSAREKSPDSTITLKLKVLSESKSIGAKDITEIQRLIDAGADVNVINKNGATTLYMIVEAGQTEIVKILLEANADVNKATNGGKTPLWKASEEGHAEIVKLLLDANADVNKADTTEGVTPLLVASQGGHAEVVKLLLGANADVNKTETKYGGITPLFMALAKDHTKIIKLLLEAGADVNVKVGIDGKEYTALSFPKIRNYTRKKVKIIMNITELSYSLAPLDVFGVLFGIPFCGAIGGVIIARYERKAFGMWAFRGAVLLPFTSLVGAHVSRFFQRGLGGAIPGLIIGVLIGLIALVVFIVESNK